MLERPDDVTGMSPGGDGSEASAPACLTPIAKAIRDLDDLVRLLARGLSRAKPWQRQLDSRLAEVQRLLQVLRLMVALERADAEIMQAAGGLATECSGVVLAIAGSRADMTTKAAVRLVSQLASKIRDELAESAARQAPTSGG